MRYLAIMAVLVAGVAWGQHVRRQSIPPETPVVINSVIGSTATFTSRVTVRLEYVATEPLRPRIHFDGEDYLNFPASDSEAVARSLTAAADASRRGQVFQAVRHDEIEISTTEINNRPLIVISQRMSIMQRSVYLDPANARQISEMLSRGIGIGAWIEERIGVFSE